MSDQFVRGEEGRRAVILRLCTLQAEVSQFLDDYSNPNDCFCGDNSAGGVVLGERFQSSQISVQFIEDAVRKEIESRRQAASKEPDHAPRP